MASGVLRWMFLDEERKLQDHKPNVFVARPLLPNVQGRPHEVLNGCWELISKFKFIKMIDVEIWKDVPGFENMYQVSNLGDVRRITHGYNVLKPDIIRGGYHRVTLSKNNIQTRFIVHILVARLFVHNPDPENKKFVNHKKGIKTDNRHTELEWCTSSENEKHSHRVLGKIPPEAKMVLDYDTGIFYESISKAATARCIKPGTLLSAIYRGNNKTSIKLV